MQQDAVVQVIKAASLSGAGTAISAVSLKVQLNAPHQFLNLELPYWMFLVSMIALVFAGAFWAPKTDYMKSQDTPTGNFFTALFMGLFLSFVVLPQFLSEPSVGIMQIVAFVSGLSGTILLRIVLQVIGDDELRESIIEAITSVIKEIVVIATNYIKSWVTRILEVANDRLL